MPGFLSVSLQNFLHGRQSGLRTQISGNNQPVKQLPVRAGGCFHVTWHRTLRQHDTIRKDKKSCDDGKLTQMKF